jgi:hypothetical protein
VAAQQLLKHPLQEVQEVALALSLLELLRE